MLIGEDDVSSDVITLGICFSMFVYIWVHFCFPLSQRGATGELKVEFKLQRRSCKLSFLFLPRCQSALESLLSGYEML